MSFTDGFYNLLSTNPSLVAVLGAKSSRKDQTTGVFPSVAPDEVTLPYLVTTIIHRESVTSYQGTNKLREFRLQVGCYGSTYEKTRIVAETVNSILISFVGQLSDGSYIEQSFLESEHDEPEPAFKGTVYGIILDYSFWVL